MLSRRIVFFGLAFLPAASALAQNPSQMKRERDNFMVVVRESIGVNATEDALAPFGKAKAKLPDGREVEIDFAAWQFIGDTHIRFVFDSPSAMANATNADLERLGLKSVDEALALALSNIKRVYGEPAAKPWTAGLMSVEGKSPDLNSSYFLDRQFWLGLAKKHPEGLVASVAKRGGLLYIPLSDTENVEKLKQGVAGLYRSSGQLRVSSALFMFKDGKWSVFQAPLKQ